MEHDDVIVGPALDRQARPARPGPGGRVPVPQRVPETRPTPLAGAFIHLSIVVLACGVVAITALELGTPMTSPWVRIPVLVGGSLLLLVTADAVVRIWRSAFAWLPVDRGRAIFRLSWVGVLLGSMLVTVVLMWIILTA